MASTKLNFDTKTNFDHVSCPASSRDALRSLLIDLKVIIFIHAEANSFWTPRRMTAPRHMSIIISDYLRVKKDIALVRMQNHQFSCKVYSY